MLMAEMATAVKYDLPIKVIIIKNNALGQIKWEQLVFLGNPEYGCELHPIDFAAFARAVGAKGYTIDDPKQCGGHPQGGPGGQRAVVIEAVVDPNEPPMPARADPGSGLRVRQGAAARAPRTRARSSAPCCRTRSARWSEVGSATPPQPPPRFGEGVAPFAL